MFNDIKHLQAGIGHALCYGMKGTDNMYTVKKETSIAGDTYAEVMKDGKLIWGTLWLGEPDAELIRQAEAFTKQK